LGLEKYWQLRKEIGISTKNAQILRGNDEGNWKASPNMQGYIPSSG
jgi:hypothetical protein